MTISTSPGNARYAVLPARADNDSAHRLATGILAPSMTSMSGTSGGGSNVKSTFPREVSVAAADGTEVRVDAGTLCLHGDSPSAVDFARRIRRELAAAGIDVVHM